MPPPSPDPSSSDGAGATQERHWWDDPRLPWKGKPGRSDLWCWTAIGLVGVYSLALLPFRPVLLATPLALAAATGSRTAAVTLGAFAAVGRMDLWWLGLIVATLSAVKFHWVFWWAGRLWGDGVVAAVGGRSPRAARRAARAYELTGRWRTPAIVATYLLPLVPDGVVYAAAGATGMRLRTLMLVDVTAAFTTRFLYFSLGYWLGQRAVDVVDTITRYSLWISLALVGVVIVGPVLRRRRDARGGPTAGAGP